MQRLHEKELWETALNNKSRIARMEMLVFLTVSVTGDVSLQMWGTVLEQAVRHQHNSGKSTSLFPSSVLCCSLVDVFV